MNENIYLNNNLGIKTVYFAITAFIDTVLAGTAAFVFPFTILDYSSAALGFFFCIAIGLGILAFLRVRSLFLIAAAKYFSRQFAKANEPFLTISNLGEAKLRNWSTYYVA